MELWSVGRTDRERKPRTIGLTHVIDTGIPLGQVQSQLDVIGEYVDYWKFGFGTSYLDPTVEKKIQVLIDAAITPGLGGTLLEAAWLESKQEECLSWAAGLGFTCVEVSNGATQMTTTEKRELIRRAAERFTVVSEVGSKDPATPVMAGRWVTEMTGDLDAGAAVVIAEGRETGTVGMYRGDGSVRWPVVDAVAAAVGCDRVIFEAPRSSQQAELIRRYGPDVSLGNIAPADVLGLEALRRGLRADTMTPLPRGRPLPHGGPAPGDQDRWPT